MVNFNDPMVIVRDAAAFLKLWHALSGLYIWEILTTLDYEWLVFRGQRPYSWTIWIYSITRASTLLAVILSLVCMDVTTQFNCQVEIVFILIFGYIAFSAASLLIVLRIIAIWNRKIVVIVIALGVWGTNVGFLIHSVFKIRAVWMPIVDSCNVLNVESTKLNITITLATDIILLFIMLVGLLRLNLHESGAFGLGRLMWRQGLIWLVIATIAEVPPATFISLNLNQPFNYMFTVPSEIAMSIAATRMHRSLANFAVNGADMISGPGTFRTTGRTTWKKASRVEVVVHTACEQYRTPQTSDPGTLFSSEGHTRDKCTGRT